MLPRHAENFGGDDNAIISVRLGGGGVKLENLLTKKAKINSVQASRFCSTASQGGGVNKEHLWNIKKASNQLSGGAPK